MGESGCYQRPLFPPFLFFFFFMLFLGVSSKLAWPTFVALCSLMAWGTETKANKLAHGQQQWTYYNWNNASHVHDGTTTGKNWTVITMGFKIIRVSKYHSKKVGRRRTAQHQNGTAAKDSVKPFLRALCLVIPPVVLENKAFMYWFMEEHKVVSRVREGMDNSKRLL